MGNLSADSKERFIIYVDNVVFLFQPAFQIKKLLLRDVLGRINEIVTGSKNKRHRLIIRSISSCLR